MRSAKDGNPNKVQVVTDHYAISPPDPEPGPLVCIARKRTGGPCTREAFDGCPVPLCLHHIAEVMEFVKARIVDRRGVST